MLFGSHSPLHIITFYIPIQLDCRCNDVIKRREKKTKKKKKWKILHKSEHVQKKNKNKTKTLRIRRAPGVPSRDEIIHIYIFDSTHTAATVLLLKPSTISACSTQGNASYGCAGPEGWNCGVNESGCRNRQTHSSECSLKRVV